ncbi:MAG: PEP-CTERM sorting domain-containing protein [Rubrivivax sp.]|jgi:hypothetical protein
MMVTPRIRRHSAHVYLPALAAALATWGVSPATAAPAAYQWGGDVTQVSFDPVDPTGGAVQAGSRLGLTLRFDTATADALADPHTGAYAFTGPPFGVFVQLGSWAVVLRNITIAIVDGTGSDPDQLLVYATEGLDAGLSDFMSFSLVLQDDSGSAFNSDALPTTLDSLGGFNVADFAFRQQFTDTMGQFVQVDMQGHVVPEPTTVGLVLCGLAGGLFGRYRARRFSGRN